MATTKYYLKDKKAKIKTRIVCILSDGRDTNIKIQTGYSVHPKDWSNSQNKVKTRDKQQRVINNYLHGHEVRGKKVEAFKDRVLGFYNDSKANGIKLNAKQLKDILEPKELVKEIEDNVINQLELYAKNKTNKSHDFVRTVNPVIQHLSRFLKIKRYKTLKFNDLNKPFLEGYEHYLSKVEDSYTWSGKTTTKRPLKSGTIARHFTHLKIVSKNLLGDLHINNAIFNHTVTEVNEVSRSLIWDELKLIMETETKTAKQQLAKDIFLFSCFTGMRVSAIQDLRVGDISNGFINWINTKSKKEPTIQTTVHQYNYAIISKYKTPISSKLFPEISQQRLNTNIKTICERAGITKPEQVHNHTGRHTYNSLLYALGVDVFVRNEELGHSHGNINQEVYTRLDEAQRKTLIVNLFENPELVINQKKQTVTTKFDDI